MNIGVCVNIPRHTGICAGEKEGTKHYTNSAVYFFSLCHRAKLATNDTPN